MNNTYNFSKTDTLCMKALAVFLMLAHHLFSFPEKLKDGAEYISLYTLSDGRSIELLLGNFGKLCVALFMFLSGYGIYISYKNSSKGITDNIYKRVKAVYIKYWQIFFIMAPLGLLIGSDKITYSICDWIKNLFALDTTFNDEWWFITTYVIILFLFPFIIRWVDRKRSNPVSDIIILITFNVFVNTILISLMQNQDIFSSFRSAYFWQKSSVALSIIPMFTIGCYMAKYNIFSQVHKLFHYEISKKLAGIFMLFIIFVLRQNWAMRTNWGWDRLDFIYAAIFCVSSSLILHRLEPVKKALSFIGKQATGIWLVHSFFCYYYFQGFTYALKNPVLIFLITLAISFAISYAVSFICSYIWKHIQILCNSDKK